MDEYIRKAIQRADWNEWDLKRKLAADDAQIVVEVPVCTYSPPKRKFTLSVVPFIKQLLP